jgi:hypothetical protein
MTIEEVEDLFLLPSLVLGFFGSWAIFAWGFGWHWWWALPAAVPAAVLVGVVVFWGVLLVLDRKLLHEFVRELHEEDEPDEVPDSDEEPDEAEEPASTSAEDIRHTTNADYQRLKRAMAKRLHPDLQPAAASRGERRVREAVFKEFWAEVEEIEGRG